MYCVEIEKVRGDAQTHRQESDLMSLEIIIRGTHRQKRDRQQGDLSFIIFLK
jgi:hypothetical protein